MNFDIRRQFKRRKISSSSLFFNQLNRKTKFKIWNLILQSKNPLLTQVLSSSYSYFLTST